MNHVHHLSDVYVVLFVLLQYMTVAVYFVFSTWHNILYFILCSVHDNTLYSAWINLLLFLCCVVHVCLYPDILSRLTFGFCCSVGFSYSCIVRHNTVYFAFVKYRNVIIVYSVFVH